MVGLLLTLEGRPPAQSPPQATESVLRAWLASLPAPTTPRAPPAPTPGTWHRLGAAFLEHRRLGRGLPSPRPQA